MHHYKTIAQILLALSIINLVFCGSCSTTGGTRHRQRSGCGSGGCDNCVRKTARDAPPGGTTPSQYSSSSSLDGSPSHDSLPLEGSAPLQGSAPLSGSAPSSHLSATDGQVPVPDSTTEASASAHPLSAADVPAPVPDSITETGRETSISAHPLSTADGPVPDSNTEASTSSLRPAHVQDSTAEGSTNSRYTAITPNMLHQDPDEISMGRKIAGFALIAAIPTAFVLFSVLYHNHHNNNSTGG